MLERIKRIMQDKGMNQTRFAEATGINPASLSGIMNRPDDRKATLDMVTKILSRFEDVNSDWLLLGTGPAYRSENVNLRIVDESDPPKELDLFQSSESSPAAKPSQALGSVSKKPDNSSKAVNVKESNFRDSSTGATQPIVQQSSTGKKIDRLTIFYTDQTFENFFPEKQDAT